MPFPQLTAIVSKTNPGPLIPVDQLRDMYAAGFNLVKAAVEGPAAKHKKLWFGTAGMTDSDSIDSLAAKLQGYMNGGMTKMNFICTGTADSMMSFNQYEHLKVKGGPPEEKLGKSTNTMVNLGFSSDRFTFGEKVGAILHEITHMCIGTTDVTHEGREIYGADYCATLAIDNPALALSNADNWCYYLTSYHAVIPERGRDWGYLTPAGVAARRRLT